MDKVYIKPNGNGDTRTANHIPTYEEFCIANDSHRDDVSSIMSRIGWELRSRGDQHDITKEVLSKMFYHDMVETMEGNMKFEDGQWAKIHYFDSCERHHLNRNVPDDVNFIDILEMICDCVCAGKARSGKDFVDVPLNGDVIIKAFYNTVELINEHIELEKEDGSESKPGILYVCDDNACKTCHNDCCHHTFKIEHAANFEPIPNTDLYIEKCPKKEE